MYNMFTFAVRQWFLVIAVSDLHLDIFSLQSTFSDGHIFLFY